MSKKNTFFIRAQVDVQNVNQYNQTEIDLGAFVDALGMSVLRIHRIDVSIRDKAMPENGIIVDASATGNITWQLTTQSHTSTQTALAKDVISLGTVNYSNVDAIIQRPTWMDDSADMLPQNYEGGYIIGTEQIYLASQDGSGGLSTTATLTVVLECSVAKLTKEAAMALALSQQ